MPEFTISPANPIHFEIQNGTGTINDGDQTIDGNFLWCNMGIYWNCKGIGEISYCQKYNSADTTSIQFIFDNSPSIPFVELIDENEDFVAVLAWTVETTDTYRVDIDWSLYSAACYQIRISSVTGGVNFFPCADSGTFETGTVGSWGFSTGGTNVLAKSSAQAQAGTFSALITSPMVPGASEREIGFCTTSFSLTSDTIYRYSGYIFDDGTDPFVQDGRTVSIDITDFSDASTISQTVITPSVDGRGQWHFIEHWFRTGADTIGQIKIVTSANPQPIGKIYADTLSIVEATTVLEAESDCLSIKTNHPCTAFATYENDDNGFGIYYDGGISFGIRLEMYAIKFKMDDPDLINEDNTIGETSTIRSVNYKTYELQTDLLPPAMVETLCLSMKHDSFILNGVPLVCMTDNIQPDWEDETFMARVTADLRVATYNLQNGSC